MGLLCCLGPHRIRADGPFRCMECSGDILAHRRVPLWIVDTLAAGGTQWTSALTHVGGLDSRLLRDEAVGLASQDVGLLTTRSGAFGCDFPVAYDGCRKRQLQLSRVRRGPPLLSIVLELHPRAVSGVCGDLPDAPMGWDLGERELRVCDALPSP